MKAAFIIISAIAPCVAGSLPVNMTISRTPSGPISSPSAFQINVSVTAKAPATGTPTGLVTFTLNGGAAPGASLNAGEATVTFPGYPSPFTQPFTIVATYPGDANFAPAMASITFDYLGEPATAQIVLQSPGLVLYKGVSQSIMFSMTPETTPTYYICSGTLPPGMFCDTNEELIVGTPTALGNYPVTITGSDGSGDVARGTFTISVVPVTLQIPGSLPLGEVGQPYTATLTPTGGIAPYQWFASGGPSGLLLSASGVYSGTPTSGGSPLSVRLTDSSNPPQTITTTLQVPIQAAFTLSQQTLPAGQVGTPYDAYLKSVGGVNPVSPTVASGSLPGGLTLGDWTIAGTPTGAGTFPFSLTASDAFGVTSTVSYQIRIAPADAGPGSGPTGSLFVPITPCRIADTRNANGPFGGPSLAGQTSRDFAIPASACGIPSNATAYSLNVAVIPAAALGYMTLWPTGQTQPQVATLTSDGRIKSNAAIVPAGSNGAISMFVTDATDAVLDINGYFVPSANTSAMAYYPVTPCRVADTRNATGPLGGPSLNGGGTRTFPILSSSCGIPSTAQAYSLNFAAVPIVPLGYLTAWPTGRSQPTVASLNAPTGTVVANAVIVPAGTNGGVDVFATNATHLVIDIDGYFAPLASGGLSLYTAAPCRVFDSRLPAGAAPLSTAKTIDVAGSACQVPTEAQAYVFNATAVPPGPLGYLTLWPHGTPQPNAATLNALDGAITSNLAIVPSGSGSVSVFPYNPTHLVLDLFGYFAP